jgi:TctA family transporter
LFGLFGVACRIFDWNRLVLFLAFASGTLLEENLRRALLLSRGDLEIFLYRPISFSLLFASCTILIAVAFYRFGVIGPRQGKSR